MKLLVLFLIIAVTAVSLVKGCSTFNTPSSYYYMKCKEWWKEALILPSSRNRKIRKCIKLIQDKCPGLVEIKVDSLNRIVFTNYALWKIRKRATHIHTLESLTFKTKEIHGVCTDANGKDGDCDLWWSAAKWFEGSHKIVDDCVTQVINHCKDQIERLSRQTDTKTCLLRKCEVVTYTYKHIITKGIVTFKRVEYV